MSWVKLGKRKCPKLICVQTQNFYFYFLMTQAAHPQKEGVAVRSALPSPQLDGSVAVCQAISYTKMGSDALLLVSHPWQQPKVEKLA